MFKYLWIVIVIAIEVAWLAASAREFYLEFHSHLGRWTERLMATLPDALILRGWILFHLAILLGTSLGSFLGAI